MELGAHAIFSMLTTLGALFLYTRARIALEYSSAAVLLVLIVAFELFPYRGDPAVPEPVQEFVRETSPAGVPELSPDSARRDLGEAQEAGDRTPGQSAEESDAETVRSPESADRSDGEIVLRGSDFLLGFGNDALITICALLILAKGVEMSGALRPVGRLLARMWLLNRHLALLSTLGLCALLSAFVNNTPVVVMMLPLLVGVSLRLGASPSKILMPVGFATIVGGMSTTIGTSTNLLVTSVSRQLGGPSFAMFDFVVPALIAAGFGILYLWALAPRLIPERETPLVAMEPRNFHASFTIDADSGFDGKTLADLLRAIDGKILVERIQRDGRVNLMRTPSLQLRAGDVLSVFGAPEALKSIQHATGFIVEDSDVMSTPDQRLVEIVVTQTSPMHGKRLSELATISLGKIYPVGLRRPARELWAADSDDPILATGDLLLVQGHRRDIRALKNNPELMILDRTVHVARTRKAPIAIAISLSVVLAAALGLVSILVSALCGVGLILIAKCLSWNEAWKAIDTKLVLVIVASLALGTSLSATGAAQFLAGSFASGAQALPAALVVSGLLLVTALITEVVTNNAVAVIATPIALGVADQLGLPPTAFVLAVLFGANMSYMTPIGYQTNLLVMSAGGYRFSDFGRAGIPLQIILWIVLSVMLPILYL